MFMEFVVKPQTDLRRHSSSERAIHALVIVRGFGRPTVVPSRAADAVRGLTSFVHGLVCIGARGVIIDYRIQSRPVHPLVCPAAERNSDTHALCKSSSTCTTERIALRWYSCKSAS